MTPLPLPTPEPWRPPGQAGRLLGRLERLLGRIRIAHPRAHVAAIEEACSGFPGFRVVLPNGVDVVVGVDIDLPEVLFEVIRLHVAGGVARFQFEARSAGGFAGFGHLSADAVLDLLHDYARTPQA